MIVDLTGLGLDLNTLIRAANNAKANPEGVVVTGFRMTPQQIDLLPILMQSTINRRTKIRRTVFMGIPIVEGEE